METGGLFGTGWNSENRGRVVEKIGIPKPGRGLDEDAACGRV